MWKRAVSGRLSLLVAVCVLSGLADGAVPCTALAKSEGSQPAISVVALFPALSDGKVVGGTLRAVLKALERAPTTLQNVQIVSGKKLRKRLHKAPGREAERCGRAAACLAQLGKRAGATDVLVPVAHAVGSGGARIEFLGVNVKTREVSREIALMLESARDVDLVIGNNLGRLFGKPRRDSEAGFVDPRAAVDVGADALALVPLPSAAAERQAAAEGAPEKEGASGARTRVAMKGHENGGEQTTEVGVLPSQGGNLAALLAAARDPAGHSDKEPAAAVAAPVVLRAHTRSSALTHLGTATASLGVAVLGVGAYYGVRSLKLRTGVANETQIDKEARVAKQHRVADRANILLWVGGATAALGGVVVLLDALMQGGSEVSLHADGSSASVAYGYCW